MKTRSTKLLSIGADAKTKKAWKEFGYMTAVMYLAPWKMAGINTCAMAEQAGCPFLCLGIESGHFNIGKDTIAPYGVPFKDNACQSAKLYRTRLYAEDRNAFLDQLHKEIKAFIKRAKKQGLKPAIRLNGTSDLDFTLVSNGAIIQAYPDVQFYDYTKIAKRAYKALPANYHLSLSYSQHKATFAQSMLLAHYKTGLNLIYVMRDDIAKHKAMESARAEGKTVVDGDLHDFRFLDPDNSLVFLRAKGKKVKESQNGFVLDFQS